MDRSPVCADTNNSNELAEQSDHGRAHDLELQESSHDVLKKTQEAEQRVPGLIMQLQLYVLVMLGGIDGVLLFVSFDAFRKDLGLTLGELAFMGMVQSLCSTVSGPLWAALADSGHLSRKKILVMGAAGQGIITVLLGIVTSWIPMLVLRGLNGVMLASLGPLVNGIVADHTSELLRGRIYGRVTVASQVGSLIGTMVGTPLASTPVFGLAGWRVMFALSGLLAIVIGMWVSVFMDLPRSEHEEAGGPNNCILYKEGKRLCKFLKIPSFDVLIISGLFGAIQMNAGGFQTLYFQTVGISDALAGTISSCGTLSVGLGDLLGGYIGDYLAAKSRNHGRILVAEVSLFIGIPLKFLTFWGIAPFEGNWVWYAVLTSLHGLLACWVTAGSKLPLLSELVPPSDRSSVMAWDGTLEGLSGTLLGSTMVAVLAKALFGFDDSDLASGKHTANARALGHASAVVICGPAIISWLLWAFMHWSYPRDLKRVRQMHPPAKV